ncbi:MULTISPECIES: IlvD/Edd family dehydratase [Methylobacterium]|uniref:IlvD/Edd family dehydratase n=1 Tax=Methylobacterium TaxID=407 RepID=UPI00035F6176|nr:MULTISPECIES: IlvD/Edd family dehydratase [Methylobacterium]MBN4096398.1 dihydroxy-acid dehydratase family protein [Methylobacterium sp. OT2]UIN36604.1 dihydroxy-acid dehydratase family protein [Methylobacterium oryzae]SEF67879.1 dihydroxy-acid dehydratase [Methylobacterium sp. 190mf]SFD35460.1 dihydroxy-acid dehydratase [Methylobacterium sp. 13MFTsu3.1M2]
MSDKRRITPADLRSKAWFDNPHNPGMTALYLERYLNYGLTPEELRSGKPLIGIAQTGSDLSPCNRHHVELAKRVRDGITAAGGVAFEFPCHPIQETGKRPTASLDRNLAYLSLVEVLYGYPLDGVVLLTGCDKTMPACLMAAATVNIPAISLNVGPMLNGYFQKELTGSGTIVWKTRERHAAGDIDFQQFMDIVGSSAPSTGHCNTMGTASTMNALAEALGLALPGSAAIPAPYRERGQAAYATGQRIVEMVWEDLKPSDILTREAFENAIVANAAIGGSTNAPIHINAIAKHIGVPLSCDDWERVGFEIPLLVDMQPAGRWLGEEYFRAGGLPAVFAELIEAGKVHEGALTCNGRTVGENYRGRHSWNRDVIRAYGEPLMERAGFLNLKGSLFDSAIMKTCVISEEFAARYLRNPNDPMAFEGRVIVFDGPEDYHTRIDDPALDIDENTILIMRGAGPIGYPGAAEVVNMQPPGALIRRGVTSLPCIGDGRQSGTSGTPAILNASPEAAVGGGLALLQSGDRIRIDLNRRSADILLPAEEIARRRSDLAARGGYPYPATQTPWQEIYRDQVDQLDQGMVLKGAVKFQKVAQASGVPRDNH